METIDSSTIYKLLSDNLDEIERKEDYMTSLQQSKFILEVNKYIGYLFIGTGVVKNIGTKISIIAPRAISTGGKLCNIILICDYDNALNDTLFTINKLDTIEFSGIITKIIQPHSRYQFNLLAEDQINRSFECIYLNLKSIRKKEIIEPSSSKNCFIATACYGDNNAHEVLVLREYRDNVLLKTKLGRLGVSLYYNISPPIARLLEKSETSKLFVRNKLLSPIVTRINQIKDSR